MIRRFDKWFFEGMSIGRKGEISKYGKFRLIMLLDSIWLAGEKLGNLGVEAHKVSQSMNAFSVLAKEARRKYRRQRWDEFWGKR